MRGYIRNGSTTISRHTAHGMFPLKTFAAQVLLRNKPYCIQWDFLPLVCTRLAAWGGLHVLLAISVFRWQQEQISTLFCWCLFPRLIIKPHRPSSHVTLSQTMVYCERAKAQATREEMSAPLFFLWSFCCCTELSHGLAQHIQSWARGLASLSGRAATLPFSFLKMRTNCSFSLRTECVCSGKNCITTSNILEPCLLWSSH